MYIFFQYLNVQVYFYFLNILLLFFTNIDFISEIQAIYLE